MTWFSLPSICRSILHTSVEDFILCSWVVSPLVVGVAIVKESPHGAALARVSHGVTEHLVDLLLRRHPPVGVGGAVHPNELCSKTGRDKMQLVFAASATAQVSKAHGK